MPPEENDSKSFSALLSEVIQLTKEVAILNATFPSHVEWVERNVKDHESRIRLLERDNAKTAWVPTLVAATLTGVIVAGISAFIIPAMTH